MLQELDGSTLLYPILGDPISFVKSPQRLSEVFRERGHNGICVPLHVSEGDLETTVKGISRAQNVRGLLITMPHKQAMFTLCKSASRTSRLLRVVSVVRRNEDGTWHGDMLDGLSFVAALTKQGAQLEGARVLQVGVGGAGSAIAIALLDAGIRKIVLNDTDEGRLRELLQLLSKAYPGRVLAGPADPGGCDVVVNATPLGMSPNDPMPVPAHLLKPSMYVGDVIAGHGITPLIAAAREAGCKTADGVQMVEAGMEIMPDFFLCS